MQHCSLVLTNPYYEGLAADCVGMDDENGTKWAVGRLIQQGHRRIAFVGGYATSSTRQRRLHSYRDTLRGQGIQVDPALCIDSPVTRRGGYDAVHQLLNLAQPPSAAYCYSDVIALWRGCWDCGRAAWKRARISRSSDSMMCPKLRYGIPA